MAPTPRDSLVAAIDGRVVGFVTASPASGDLGALLGNLEPATRTILGPLGAPDEPRTIRIVAPSGVAPRVGPRDQLISAIAVDPRFRRRGVARALAVGQLALAEHAGVPQMFVHSIAGSGSAELFAGLGFTPLLELGRYYPDGTGMTFLFKALG
jgi:ribosomal protein S18 acetylase RimI-like enzyme